MKKHLFFFLLSLFLLPNFAAAQNAAPAENATEGDIPHTPNVIHEPPFWTNMAFSFFGTAGYAISNRPYAYQNISNKGTWNNLSNIGAQLDWQITPRWGLTVQGEIAPSLRKDKHWNPQWTWGFLSFRATDNWLLRFGRIRLPALLYTQNSNVGMSYIPARLPVEVYSLSPTYDFNGISSSYSWDVGDDGLKTLSWDAYAGVSFFQQRVWLRDSYPGVIQQGANYYSRRMNVVGTFLTFEDLMENNTARVGVHYVVAKDRNGGDFLKKRSIITLPNNAQVYSPSGGERTKQVNYFLFALMADWHLGKGFYGTGELGIMRSSINANTGLAATAFYLQLRKRFGNFTPYISWGYSISNSQARKTYKGLSNIIGHPLYDMLNRISGDTTVLKNQSTFAIGTAYDINAHHRIKAEYSNMRIGNTSSLVDRRLEDGNLNGKRINILTISYNFLF